jgi:hypothetical protein
MCSKDEWLSLVAIKWQRTGASSGIVDMDKNQNTDPRVM